MRLQYEGMQGKNYVRDTRHVYL